jgi:hypothetical protein
VVAIRAQAGALPEPRGEYIRGHWPGQEVYRLADEHGLEIHVPATSPARLSGPDAPRLRGGAQGKGRAHRNAVHRAFFIEGPNVGDDAMVREAFREVAPAPRGTRRADRPHRRGGLILRRRGAG